MGDRTMRIMGEKERGKGTGMGGKRKRSVREEGSRGEVVSGPASSQIAAQQYMSRSLATLSREHIITICTSISISICIHSCLCSTQHCYFKFYQSGCTTSQNNYGDNRQGWQACTQSNVTNNQATQLSISMSHCTALHCTALHCTALHWTSSSSQPLPLRQ